MIEPTSPGPYLALRLSSPGRYVGAILTNPGTHAIIASQVDLQILPAQIPTATELAPPAAAVDEAAVSYSSTRPELSEWRSAFVVLLSNRQLMCFASEYWPNVLEFGPNVYAALDLQTCASVRPMRNDEGEAADGGDEGYELLEVQAAKHRWLLRGHSLVRWQAQLNVHLDMCRRNVEARRLISMKLNASARSLPSVRSDDAPSSGRRTSDAASELLSGVGSLLFGKRHSRWSAKKAVAADSSEAHVSAGIATHAPPMAAVAGTSSPPAASCMSSTPAPAPALAVAAPATAAVPQSPTSVRLPPPATVHELRAQPVHLRCVHRASCTPPTPASEPGLTYLDSTRLDLNPDSSLSLT